MQRYYQIPKRKSPPKEQPKNEVNEAESSKIGRQGVELGMTFMNIIQKEVDKIFAEKVESAVAAIQAAHHADPPRTYTRSQVCEALKCSTVTFAKLVKRGQLLYTRVGRSILIYADDFDSKLASNYFSSI